MISRRPHVTDKQKRIKINRWIGSDCRVGCRPCKDRQNDSAFFDEADDGLLRWWIPPRRRTRRARITNLPISAATVVQYKYIRFLRI